MKIFTKINYKWLDGQLIETSSKSFEYEGDLTLCGGGGGGGAKSGGGGGSGSGISMSTEPFKLADDFSLDLPDDPVGNLQDTVTSVTGEDPIGSVQEQIETVVEENTDNLSQAEGSINETIAATMDTTQSNIEDTVAANTESWEDLESGINTNVDYLHDYGKAVNTVVSDELGRWQDAVHSFTGDVQEFLAPTTPGDDVAVPDKLKAVKRGLKNKSRANLKVNKSLGRARSSLRIG